MTELERVQHDQFLQNFMQHQDALRGFVRSLVPTRDDAQDVMQEVAAVLWSKFGELSSPADFRRWAFGVARFEALAFMRDRARNRHVLSANVLELLAKDASEQQDLLADERAMLENCLSKLPLTQRALVTAAYAPGVEIQKLAGSLGRSAMSVYKELHRIRVILMTCAQKTVSIEDRA